MRVLSSEALAALDSGRFTVRALLRVDIPGTDPFCVWDGHGDIIVEGQTYLGAPGRFTLEPSTSIKDLSVRNLDITFSGLDSTVTAIIDGQPWHQAPVLLQRAIIATESPAVLHIVPEFSGALDQMFKREQPGGTYSLVFRCESASRDLTRNAGSRTRGDSDQRERDADDGFFRFAVSAVTTKINWGRTTG